MKSSNIATLPTYGLGAGSSNYTSQSIYSPSQVIWEWNKQDLSQFDSPIDINGGIALGSAYSVVTEQARTSAATLTGPYYPKLQWAPTFAGAATYKGIFLPIKGLTLPDEFDVVIVMDRPGGGTQNPIGAVVAWQDTSHFLCWGTYTGATTITLCGHNNTAATTQIANLSGTWTGSCPSVVQTTYLTKAAAHFEMNWGLASPGAGAGVENAGLIGASSLGPSGSTLGYMHVSPTGAAGWNMTQANRAGIYLYHTATAGPAASSHGIFHLGFYRSRESFM